uniref:Acyltransferase 3 domain-containing protein n=1 Tax=Anopheles farauti TaxID=69004 RepID=A0A182Q9L9_9DIPT
MVMVLLVFGAAIYLRLSMAMWLMVVTSIIACCAESFADQAKLINIYQYDDYEECQRVHRDFVYCTAKAHLLPSTNSVIWRDIELNSTVELMRCISAEDSTSAFSVGLNAPQIGFLCFALGALMLVSLATVLDDPRDTSKGKTGSSLYRHVVQSFSLSRNLSKLVERDIKSTGHNLRHLDGIRALTMMIILLTHSSIPLIRMPLKNIDQLEAQFNEPWFPIAMAGNTYTVQIFFVIGGLLLAVNSLEQDKPNVRCNVQYLINRVKFRLIRILPLYLFVILFHASWYQRLYEGPIGDRFKDYCTTNWWTNVIFLNNYIKPSEPCIQFAWYLGADFQLYLLGTMLMMLMRIPKLTKAIVTFMVVSAFLVPAIVIYHYNLDATVMMILRYILQEIRTLPYYLRVYIPFETNAGNYFFGMLAGMSYFHYKDRPAATTILKLKCLLPCSATLFVLMNGLTMLLPDDHLSEPSLALAVFGSTLKCAWGLFASTLLLHLAFQRTPSMLVATLQHPILLVGSKLSYSAYLVQYSIIYTVYKYITYPLMYDTFTILLFTAAIINITFFVAFLLHLFIEVPFNTFLRRILS